MVDVRRALGAVGRGKGSIILRYRDLAAGVSGKAKPPGVTACRAGCGGQESGVRKEDGGKENEYIPFPNLPFLSSCRQFSCHFYFFTEPPWSTLSASGLSDLDCLDCGDRRAGVRVDNRGWIVDTFHESVIFPSAFLSGKKRSNRRFTLWFLLVSTQNTGQGKRRAGERGKRRRGSGEQGGTGSKLPFWQAASR